MTEVTRVPVKPINKWSLIMLFVGIALGLAIAGGFAWYSRPKGVDVDEVRAGAGAHPKDGDVVFMRYTGKLENGTVFDKSQDLQLPIKGILPEGFPMQIAPGSVIEGFREAILKMQKGGKYLVTIPAAKAYGATPPAGSPIPPNATLVFDVEIVDFLPLQEANRRGQILQQQMMARQQQAPQPGAGGVPPASTAPGAVTQ